MGRGGNQRFSIDRHCLIAKVWRPHVLLVLAVSRIARSSRKARSVGVCRRFTFRRRTSFRKKIRTQTEWTLSGRFYVLAPLSSYPRNKCWRHNDVIHENALEMGSEDQSPSFDASFVFAVLMPTRLSLFRRWRPSTTLCWSATAWLPISAADWWPTPENVWLPS